MKTQIISIFILLSLICLIQARWDGKTCGEGYFLDVTQQCVACTDSNCKVCSDAYSCTECYSQFELVQRQPTDIVQTYEFTTSVWTSSTPSAAPYAQKWCTNKDKKFLTGLQFFNDNVFNSYHTVFQGCASICSSYNAFTFCTSCLDGYFQYGPFCLNCFEDGCKTCSDELQGSCTECRPGYVLSALGQCIPCGFACDACELDEQRLEYANTLQSRTKGIKCTSCRQVTGNAWYHGIGPNKDLQPQGTLLIGDQCISCPANCEQCSDRLNCSVCQDQYYLDSTVTPKVCKACTAHYCDSSDTTFLACVGDTYRLLGGVCVAEPVPGTSWQGCTAWDSTGLCTACVDGLGLTVQSGVCGRTVNSECLKVSSTDATKCEVCIQGYYYKDATDFCQPCTDFVSGAGATGCEYAADGTTQIITSCKMGQYLSSGSCSACDSGCIRCDSADWCTECAAGYYFDVENHECTACGGSCYKCNSAAICLICLPGYYNRFGTCGQEATCKYHDPETGICVGCDLAYGNIAHLHEQMYDPQLLLQCFQCGSIIDIQGDYLADNPPVAITDKYALRNREPNWVLVACEPICAADYRESVNAFTLSFSMIVLILSLIL